LVTEQNQQGRGKDEVAAPGANLVARKQGRRTIASPASKPAPVRPSVTTAKKADCLKGKREVGFENLRKKTRSEGGTKREGHWFRRAREKSHVNKPKELDTNGAPCPHLKVGNRGNEGRSGIRGRTPKKESNGRKGLEGSGRKQKKGAREKAREHRGDELPQEMKQKSPRGGVFYKKKELDP